MSTLLLLLLAVPRPGPLPEPAGEGGRCFVLIVTGHPGNELYARHYRDRTRAFTITSPGKPTLPPRTSRC